MLVEIEYGFSSEARGSSTRGQPFAQEHEF
jgi:hypothetical protein